MRAEDFHCWLSQAGELTPFQRQQVIEWPSQERQPVDVIRSILDLEPVCPYCHHTPLACIGAMRMGCPVIAIEARQKLESCSPFQPLASAGS